MTEWPIGSADVYFQIGIAYTEMVDHSSALEAFNNAIRINPEYAEVTFFRDILKLVHSVPVSILKKTQHRYIESKLWMSKGNTYTHIISAEPRNATFQEYHMQ